jgi:serine/threonine-protein kinase
MEFYCNNIGRMIGEKFTLEEPSRIIRPAKAIDYVNQILDGLRYIHAAGIVHRDIKPQNILMTDHDTVKICDFGMALQAEGESFGSEGLIIGSPYYSAPEQSNDPSSADRRSDLYSTGVFMYRMLTGELPGMKSFMLSRVNPLYDKKWDVFFETILNWMPDNRYQSADEMTEALLQLKLNWKKKKQFPCRTHEDESVSDSSSHPSELRSLPIRESGQNAQNVFKVNQLWQPVTYTRNSFSQKRSETVFDKETGLVWQRTGSDYPVDRDEADEIIAALNGANFGGFSSWRLPTVNELLTFLDDQAQSDNDCDDNSFSRSQNWLWSCDRRSEKTSWFVNLKIGYVDWQENGCRYFARAVCSDQSA